MKNAAKFAVANLEKIVKLLVIIMVPIILLTGYQLFSAGKKSLNDESIVTFNDGWKYRWADSSATGTVNLPGVVKGGRQGRVLILKNTIPDVHIAPSVLFFRTSQQYLSIRINGNLIYTYGSKLSRDFTEFNKLPGSSWHFLRLPQDSPGSEVEIWLISPYKQYAGLVNAIQIGTKGALLFDILSKYSLPIIISGILILLGFVEIILFQTLAHKKKLFDGVYLLGVFSLLAGIWSASESKIIQLYISNPILIFYFACISVFLLPIPLLLFIVRVYSPKDSRALIFFKNIFLVCFILASILHITGLMPFINSIIGFHLLVILASVTIIAISIKELRTGNNSIKIFFIGCILLTVFILADLLKFYFSSVPWANAQFFTQFGILVFTMLMTISLGIFILSVYENEAKNEIYEHLAYTDILTGLKNRTSFEEEIQRMNSSPDSQTDASIIIFDLNNLKDTNDTLGHKEGDQLIKNGAELIGSTFREFGEIYRIGGDEFVVLSAGYREPVLKNLLKLFAEKLDAFNSNENNLSVGIAWGMATYRKAEDHDLYSVFVRADKAMYECKKIQKHLPA